MFSELPETGEVIGARIHGLAESEKKWLHIDDNEATILQYKDEDFVINRWRTVFLPIAAERELLTLHAVAVGVASEEFYKKREARELHQAEEVKGSQI